MVRRAAACVVLLVAFAACSGGTAANDAFGDDAAVEAEDVAPEGTDDADEAADTDTGDVVDTPPDGTSDAEPEASEDDAGEAAEPLRVLFIGNSYTYQNDLPGRVELVAASDPVGPAIDAESIAIGGARLMDHLATASTVAAIHDGGWDFVVLQGQSVEPVVDPAGFAYGATGLAAEIAATPAESLFFETWARRAGDAVYAESWSGGTPAAMQAGLRDGYQSAADAAGGRMVPVGDAWERTLADHPAIVLFDADGSHPSEAGTYLAACVFYAVLTGRPLTAIGGAPAGLSEPDAAALRAAAEGAVFP
ncbi:MAG: hypothetical protein HY905_22580 [Deltaproteobacteria bacterium]|nr:hypothetical protein [Deltaproteobacteria bacterium]